MAGPGAAKKWPRAFGDVGDLVKRVMAHEGVRRVPDAEDKLAHELADCLGSGLVLSQMYGIDLEQAF